ncbi:phage tail protein [Algoriphagus formosus]|uniref:Phage tail protein n=1 Tax=Algoriphagus formosus TaxID=2007308 RepID=A0A4R5VE25_9BACT|nr:MULTISPECIES: tail fiber protein [Algoriphagus]TDK50631.1 phage tail protein [Algoriphagus aquimaris]
MESYLSTIMGWGPTWAPRGWSLCQGQLIAISQFTAVFSLIGTIYGGDGRTTFALPDLRGRAPVGAGQSPGTSFHQQGAKQGSETTTLTQLEMPVHNHNFQASALQVTIEGKNVDGNSNDPNGKYFAKAVTPANGPVPAGVAQVYTDNTSAANVPIAGGSITGTGTTGNAGGSQPISIVQPIGVIQFIFCMQGIFPPRN